MIELPCVALLLTWSPSAAEQAPLGVPGTLVALAAAMAALAAAVAQSWRTTPTRPLSRAIPPLLVAVAALLAVLTFGLFGSPAVILLLHCTICAAVLAALTRRQVAPA